MAIIDKTYFINDIQLPTDEVGAKIDALILRMEPEIIEKCLGFSLKNEFYTALLNPSPEQKWLDLRDGKIYEIDGISYQWIGFKNTQKQSIISYFIYCEYLLETTKNIASSGGKIVQAENSIISDSYVEQMRIFNRAVVLMQQLDDFINYSNGIDSTTYQNYSMDYPGKMIFL